MQLLRLLLTGIVVILGLLAAAAVMLVGVILFTVQRLLGTPRLPPHLTPSPPRPMRTADVIDIEVTEVKN